MKLDNQAINHLANLAKIELEVGEADVYSQQLSAVLGHLDNLSAADQFIQQAQLADQVDDYQPRVAPVDLSADEVAAWPADETAASMTMAGSQSGQPVTMPPIRG